MVGGIYQIIYMDKYKIDSGKLGGSLLINFYNNCLSLKSSNNVLTLIKQDYVTGFVFTQLFRLSPNDYFNFSFTDGVFRGYVGSYFSIHKIA